MRILMISGDNSIVDAQSEAYARMQWYASACDELHVVVLCSSADAMLHEKNLFVYPAIGNAVARRMRAYRIGRGIAAHRLIDIVTAQAPDELGLIAYAIATSCRVRLQLQVHTDILSPWYRSAGITARIKYTFAQFLLPRANCVRVVSARIARSLVNELNINGAAISLLPMFTDVSKFIAQSAERDEKHYRREDTGIRMVAVGRFVDREKNFHTLICAMREVVNKGIDATLTIIGDGPDKEYYQSLIRVFDLGKNVFLKPWQHDVRNIYRSFDLCVIPSYIEGWGRAAVEALASGLPVLMTDVGLAGEVVRDGVNGMVVPVGDRSALADAIITLAQSPETRTLLAKGARETARELASLTPQDYIMQWKKSFECCLVRRN